MTAAEQAKRIDAHVKRAVAGAPRLSNEQRTKLWELLRPIREQRGEALRANASRGVK